MASFADSITALVAERDRQFVERIAKEYNLNFEELIAKYLETAEMAIKVPRKYTKKAKSVEVGEGAAPDAKEVTKSPKVPKEKPCCTAQTSKKEPCKFAALKGEVFCKRHLNQSLSEAEPKKAKEPKSVEVGDGAAPDATEVTKAPKATKEKPCCTAQTSKKEPCKFSALKGEVFCKRHLKQSMEETAPKTPKEPKVPKVVSKAEQPVHTHPLTEIDEACDLCASHGNPLKEAEQDFEIVKPSPHTGPVKQLTTAQRLAEILNSGDTDEEDEDEDEAEVHLDQEEYEEDD